MSFAKLDLKHQLKSFMKYLFIIIPILFFSQSNRNPPKNLGDYEVGVTKKLKKEDRLDNPTQNIYILISEKNDIDEDYFVGRIISTFENKLINLQYGSLIMIQEALDRNNVWRPIEVWRFGTCASGYGDVLYLKKNNFAEFPIKRYNGNFKTKVRLKLRDANETYYSEIFEYRIDESLFETTKQYSNYSVLNETNLRN